MLPEAVLNYETYAFFIGVSIIVLKKDSPLTVLYFPLVLIQFIFFNPFHKIVR